MALTRDREREKGAAFNTRKEGSFCQSTSDVNLIFPVEVSLHHTLIKNTRERKSCLNQTDALLYDWLET